MFVMSKAYSQVIEKKHFYLKKHHWNPVVLFYFLRENLRKFTKSMHFINKALIFCIRSVLSGHLVVLGSRFDPSTGQIISHQEQLERAP